MVTKNQTAKAEKNSQTTSLLDQVMEQLQANDSVELATYPVTMDSAREKLEAAIQAHYKIVNKEEHQIAIATSSH